MLGGHWGGIRNSEGGVKALRAGSGRNRPRVIIYFSVSNHAESPGIVAKNCSVSGQFSAFLRIQQPAIVMPGCYAVLLHRHYFEQEDERAL